MMKVETLSDYVQVGLWLGLAVKEGGQPQDHKEFGACSGVQAQVASRGLPLHRPTSLPHELYFQYFLCFFTFLCYGNIFIILIIFDVFSSVWYFSCFSMFFSCFWYFLIIFLFLRYATDQDHFTWTLFNNHVDVTIKAKLSSTTC